MRVVQPATPDFRKTNSLKVAQQYRANQARHQELVALKYGRGLTPAEVREWDTLAERMDREEEPFYNAVVAAVN